LTTLAGFVLVPFALWNKTAFLAERVLAAWFPPASSLSACVIVGIGGGLFAGFGRSPAQIHPGQRAGVDARRHALLGLGFLVPALPRTGVGAPQLGAGSAAATALGVAGVAVAGGTVAAVSLELAAALLARPLHSPATLARPTPRASRHRVNRSRRVKPGLWSRSRRCRRGGRAPQVVIRRFWARR